jgi:hypothetical protein
MPQQLIKEIGDGFYLTINHGAIRFHLKAVYNAFWSMA